MHVCCVGRVSTVHAYGVIVMSRYSEMSPHNRCGFDVTSLSVLGIGVDTHVHHISNRLGWVKAKTPEETRMVRAWVL